MTITLDQGVADEPGVTPKQGVSDTRSITVGDNLVVFLLLEDGSFLLQEDGVSRVKQEKLELN